MGCTSGGCTPEGPQALKIVHCVQVDAPTHCCTVCMSRQSLSLLYCVHGDEYSHPHAVWHGIPAALCRLPHGNMPHHCSRLPVPLALHVVLCTLPLGLDQAEEAGGGRESPKIQTAAAARTLGAVAAKREPGAIY